MCGGTVRNESSVLVHGGLSPRVRGNLQALLLRFFSHRSIPACAGEPGTARKTRSVSGVYPRVCGGTNPCASPVTTGVGLSPRVRGNRNAARGVAVRIRSIPACAGEPLLKVLVMVQFPVYPRVCGGTAATKPSDITSTGLSPRVRGNRTLRNMRRTVRRSIPACAGEPLELRTKLAHSAVYPRVCGGTRLYSHHVWLNWGLSPRVRGNPRSGSLRTHILRSIPACAGEPAYSIAMAMPREVYPRVCGGTLLD